MIGFCVGCGIRIEMVNLETIRLPSLDHIHKGNCSSCGGAIYRRVKDDELLVARNGRKYPEVVFVGKDTPKRLFKHKIGQEIHTKEGIEKTEKVKGVKTLKDIKKEVKSK